MENCTQCNNRFSFHDRFKAYINSGNLKCSSCNVTYKSKFNLYRGIYVLIVYFSTTFIFNTVVNLNNFILDAILQVSIMTVIVCLFDLLPHRWQRYKKIG